MDNRVEIVTVDATNVAEQGFFCYKSKRKSVGYRKKLNWLEQRFSESMRIKILYEGDRSVVPYQSNPGTKSKDFRPELVYMQAQG